MISQCLLTHDRLALWEYHLALGIHEVTMSRPVSTERGPLGCLQDGGQTRAAQVAENAGNDSGSLPRTCLYQKEAVRRNLATLLISEILNFTK